MRLTLALCFTLIIPTVVPGLQASAEGGFAERPGVVDDSLAAFLDTAPPTRTAYLSTVLDGLGMVYDAWLSRQDGPRCLFSPSCSAYARQALTRHGLLEGWALTGGRLLRCNSSARRGGYPLVFPDYEGILRIMGRPTYPECSAWAPLNYYVFAWCLQGLLLDPTP